MTDRRLNPLGRYRVKRVLGEGAMGSVYMAEDPVIGREVAVKVVKGNPGLSEAELEALHGRFEQEFKLAGSLSHPGIVTIYDVGQEDGSTFVAMEYIRGEALDDILASDRELSWNEITDIGVQVADALDYAHEQGVIHRDVKPANIMMTRKGRPKLTDFGIAKAGGTSMTQTGMIVGTPAYMSPEQITGKPITPAVDQFAFAVIMFEMLTGNQPFAADSPTSLMFKIVHEAPPSPLDLNPDLPAGVEAVLMKALAKEPEDRFESCHDFMVALKAAFAGEPLDATVVVNRRVRSNDATSASDAGATLATGEEATLVSAERPGLEPEGTNRTPLLVAAGVAIVVLVGGGWWWSSRPSDTAEPAGAGAPTSPEQAPTPAPVEASSGGGQGAEGSEAGDASAVAGGADAEPAAPAPVPITVTSAPPGARILLDGEDTGQVTPSQVDVVEGESRDLRLELEGHDAASWTLALDALSDEQRADETVHFPLQPSTPPGYVALNASYPVSVTVGGRTYGPSSQHRIAVREGTYDVRLRAPGVFLDTTERVTVRSDGTSDLAVPDTVTISVLAQPSNCMIYIDGREVDYAPLTELEITVGRHTFRFDWPEPIGETVEQTESIRRDGQRVFGRSE